MLDFVNDIAVQRKQSTRNMELILLYMYTSHAFAIFWRKLLKHEPLLKSVWDNNPDSKVHGANMGPNWVLSASDRPIVGPMNLAIRGVFIHDVWMTRSIATSQSEAMK